MESVLMRNNVQMYFDRSKKVNISPNVMSSLMVFNEIIQQ